MRRITSILLTLAVLMSLAAPVTYAADLLDGKSVYYTDESDYMDGDCILTATRMMIRRAAIMGNNENWSEITNESLRPVATEDGLLLYSFCYDAGETAYKVECGSFTGESTEARIGEFESLLKLHPEGIVVWGIDAASTGTHGVLVVEAEDENGEVYAMDSSYNMGAFNEGIQKWTDTTMLDPSLVTDYWYISGIRPGSGIADDFMNGAEMITARCFSRLGMRTKLF